MTDHQRFKLNIILIDVDHQEIKPEFHTPLVHQLKPLSETVRVDVELNGDQLILRRNDESSIIFRRPSYCPFTKLCLEKNSSLILEHPSNIIAVGVVILLESHDRSILLTRRSSHMRTFPCCWVCPGGGVEKGETLLQAGLRELTEEVGIELNENQIEQSNVIALWESSYPVDLNHGLPRRHHLVVYVHVRSLKVKNDLTIKIDSNEVDAYTWLSFDQIGLIYNRNNISNNLQTFDAHIDQRGVCSLPFDTLTTADYNQRENLTNGTRFALDRWYKSKLKHESISTPT